MKTDTVNDKYKVNLITPQQVIQAIWEFKNGIEPPEKTLWEDIKERIFKR